MLLFLIYNISESARHEVSMLFKTTTHLFKEIEMTISSVANSFISTKEKLSTLADNYSELSWIKNKNSFGQKQVADIIRITANKSLNEVSQKNA